MRQPKEGVAGGLAAGLAARGCARGRHSRGTDQAPGESMRREVKAPGGVEGHQEGSRLGRSGMRGTNAPWGTMADELPPGSRAEGSREGRHKLIRFNKLDGSGRPLSSLYPDGWGGRQGRRKERMTVGGWGGGKRNERMCGGWWDEGEKRTDDGEREKKKKKRERGGEMRRQKEDGTKEGGQSVVVRSSQSPLQFGPSELGGGRRRRRMMVGFWTGPKELECRRICIYQSVGVCLLIDLIGVGVGGRTGAGRMMTSRVPAID